MNQVKIVWSTLFKLPSLLQGACGGRRRGGKAKWTDPEMYNVISAPGGGWSMCYTREIASYKNAYREVVYSQFWLVRNSGDHGKVCLLL